MQTKEEDRGYKMGNQRESNEAHCNHSLMVCVWTTRPLEHLSKHLF